ncbi:helix-turn-helix domain-containing protein [Bacteroides cellulosilyticus]|uniref:helix-turn-helix domain-containing protein n=1 Tax=Bacteroides cellulosilyticus TaxID=246787 RepID=UPI00101D098C|nr:helix-turn-helix transcriptional regulator [Bacteroides cellulosilyticus]
MKHFGNQLDELFRKKRIVQKDFAEKMGVTAVTITKWKSQESIDAAKLESISKQLNVPISYWFDETHITNQSIANGNGSAASIYGNASAGVLADKDKEIAHLKDLLKEKERTIQILMNK